MRESRVEAKLTKAVRLAGGLSIKLMPTHVGLPDRLIIKPGGEVWFIEVKTTVGKLRAAQTVWLERAAELGARVSVLYGPDDVDRWIKEHLT